MTEAGGPSRSLDARRRRYAHCSAALARMDDAALQALATRRSALGRGATHVASVDGHPVFVKRLPLTAIEAARPYSTRNHYRLPAFYNYGVGSAGFGAWREVAAHVAATGAVLSGECEHFTVLFHHRVLPRSAPAFVGPTDLDAYIRQWNGSRAIRNYMDARRDAPHELWMVMEHVPHTLGPWLIEHQDAVDDMAGQVACALAALAALDTVHFDAHDGNVVTDGTTAYLTDFGLASQGGFGLSAAERDFLGRHRCYDRGEALYSLATTAVAVVRHQPPDRLGRLTDDFGITAATSSADLLRLVARQGDALVDRGVPLRPALLDFVRRVEEPAVYMAEFFARQRPNPRKDTPYDDAILERLLREAGL